MPRCRTRRNATPETDEPINTDTTVGSMNQAYLAKNLAKLIDDQIVAAVPTIVAQLKEDTEDQGNNGGSSGGIGAGSGFTGGSGAGCAYKSFLACRPPTFKGTDGSTNGIH
jgi:uncharacterized membrane protein YgcG